MLPVIKMSSENRMNIIPFISHSNIVAADMNSNLTITGVKIADGFVVTAEAFKIFLKDNNLQLPLEKILQELDTHAFSNIDKIGKAARQLVLNNELPHRLEVEIKNAHYKLCGEETNVLVKAQGSATTKYAASTFVTEQLETFLNIRGEDALANAVHKSFASLFTERWLKSFAYKKIQLENISINISIQKFVPADPSSLGQVFTFDKLKSFNKIMSFKTVEQGSSL